MAIEKMNRVTLIGVIEKIEFDHMFYRNKIYKVVLKVLRASKIADHLPVMVREFDIDGFCVGEKVEVHGVIRSHDKYDEENRRHLDVYVHAVGIKHSNAKIDGNDIFLAGTICRDVILRETPLGKTIAEILLKIPREKSVPSVVPVIAWGNTAKVIYQNYKRGDELKFYGRFQSREYDKKYDDGVVEKKVVHEISLMRLF